jgi:hypothetical protein
MKTLSRLTILAAGALLAAAPLAAQLQPRLAVDARFNTTNRLRVDFHVQGPPLGLGVLLIAPGELIVPPLPTPWGSLYVDPGQILSVPIQLDQLGLGGVGFTLPQNFQPFVLGAQVIAADRALNMALSNPAAIAAAAAPAQVLAYAGGQFKASGTGKRGQVVQVKAKKKDGTREVLAEGIVQQDDQEVRLEGAVPNDPKNPTERVELWINGGLVQWVKC